MRSLALLIALAACGKPDRPADRGSGSSGSGTRSTPSDANAPLPLAARCSGRWTGTIKWTKPTCSDSVLASAADFAMTIHAEKEAWQIEVEKPARGEHTSAVSRRDLEVTWDARPGHESCSASVVLDWNGAKPESTDITFTLGDGAAGPTAHALLHHRSRKGDECDAEGSTTPTHEPDQGLVPEPVYDRYAIGDYKLAITWTEPSKCDVGVQMPDALAFRIDIDAAHSNRLVATGMTVPAGALTTDKIDARGAKLEITGGVDVGPHRHVLVQKLSVDSASPVSGEVLFSVLDGDLVLCTRAGTLGGTRAP